VQTSKLVALLAGLAIAAPARAQEPGIEGAKQLFAQYFALEQAYDPRVADLYTDDAFIKTRHKPPMGEARDVTIPAPEYKTRLRQHMAVAQARGDRSSYANVTYTPEGAFVRIDASRLMDPRKNASPITLRVGQSPSGRWLIYEEWSAAPPWER
jgi:hypothetical protein